MLKRFTISQGNIYFREFNRLCYKIKYFIDLDKTIGFIVFCKLEHVPTILQELHNGVGGGHFSLNIMVKKIFDVDYWWPTINRDVHELCRTCDLCQ